MYPRIYIEYLKKNLSILVNIRKWRTYIRIYRTHMLTNQPSKYARIDFTLFLSCMTLLALIFYRLIIVVDCANNHIQRASSIYHAHHTGWRSQRNRIWNRMGWWNGIGKCKCKHKITKQAITLHRITLYVLLCKAFICELIECVKMYE